MSSDNYVVVRRFGKKDYRWGVWFASEDDPDFSDENFEHGPFDSIEEAAKDATEELMIIEYGIIFEDNCLRRDIEKDDLDFIIEIGKEICECCGPDRDCALEYDECHRIRNSIELLNEYLGE